MKATGITVKEFEHYNKENFIYCRKFDGSRTLFKDGRLVSDNRDGFKNERYNHITQALKNFDGILDGELWVKQDRVTELAKKENWKEAVFIVFDILEIDGTNLRNKTLKERRAILETLNFQHPIYITEQYKNLNEAWKRANEGSWEGLIAKDIRSPYLEKRSPYWLKLKRYNEAVVTIDSLEQTNTQLHGTFICSDEVLNDIRVGSLSTKYVDDYLKAKEKGKVVKAEIQYLNKTNTGHYFQPTLKRLLIEVVK